MYLERMNQLLAERWDLYKRSLSLFIDYWYIEIPLLIALVAIIMYIHIRYSR